MSHQRGFTLIEILIVVAIVSIIAAVAFPGYQDNVRQGVRQLGKTSLAEVRVRQEQFFVNNKTYATNLTNLGYPANGFYINNDGDEQATASGSAYLIQLSVATATTFTAQAVPQNSQADDDQCMTLSLTHQGTKAATGSRGADCW